MQMFTCINLALGFVARKLSCTLLHIFMSRCTFQNLGAGGNDTTTLGNFVGVWLQHGRLISLQAAGSCMQLVPASAASISCATQYVAMKQHSISCLTRPGNCMAKFKVHDVTQVSFLAVRKLC